MMKHFFAMAALGLACAACQPSAVPPAQSPPPAQAEADAKQPGAPGASSPSPTTSEGAQASAPPPGQAAKAEVGDLVPGIPACSAGDNRTPIPVWKPSVDAQNTVDTEPPRGPDQVVVLALESHHEPKCNDKDLNIFHLNNTNGDPGALEIGVSGNTQEVDGVCHLNGLYRSEAAKGADQGQTVVHFGAVDASEIASANTYCVQQ